MVLNGLYIGTISLVAFRFGSAVDPAVAHTMTFMVLSISQLFHCLNCRSLQRSIFHGKIRQNRQRSIGKIGSNVHLSVS